MVEPDAEEKYSTVSGEQQPEEPDGAGLLAEPSATARDEVDEVLALLVARGIALGRQRALDFGCDIGEHTRALAEHFDTCDGVDLAPLIDQARELAPESDRVRFHHTTSGDLRLFDDAGFDFILALTAFRQMEPERVRGYIGEFLRVLRPGGVAFFNLAENQDPAEELPSEDVVAMVEDAGGLMLETVAQDHSGPSTRSLGYVVARAAAPTPIHWEGDPDNQQAVMESRIRRALTYSPGPSTSFRRLFAVADQRSEWRGAAMRLVGERADLVGFGLSSRLRGVGRLSTLVRDGLRRALFEVFFRQSEFNRSSGELIRAHEVQLEALGATVRAQLGVQVGAEQRLDELVRRLGRVEVNSAALARGAVAVAARSGVGEVDYVSFAERFYGGVEARREGLRGFVPRFVGRSEVVDVGCGRGEFLELLRESGVPAVGVDRDEGMVGWCRGRGLDVVRGDVLEFLGGRAEGSLGGIFGGLVVEHLGRGEIVELVRLAASRLRPGGVLVLEAVNPLCLLTYGGFYGDLTRVAPVPPLALQWLAESCGFMSVGVEYAGPVPEERKLELLPGSAGEEVEVEAFNRGVAAANELLFGFQEYVLTAHKPY